jgi:hypothetical protein
MRRRNGLRPTRRGFLAAGAFAGISFGELLRAQDGQTAAGAGSPPADAMPPRADGVIHVHLAGGIAQQETFDPKPWSPLEYRGEGRARDTSIPGVQFGESLVQTARVADRLTVLRSMSHGEAAHERGTHNMLTGQRPSPAVVYPSLGSVVAHELGARASLPPYVCVPSLPDPFAGNGYLSSSYAPFALGSAPESRDFRVRDLEPPEGVDEARFARRRELLAVVDAGFDGDGADSVAAMEAFYERAYELLGSSTAKAAFDVRAEPKELRERYGRGAEGQRLLLARRLVESGVRYASIGIGGWDLHERLFPRMRQMLPRLDQAFAALIEDLEARGMLDRTLVLLTTEFGRTPKVNKDGGRDHWPGVFSVVLAGGGVKRGYVHGRSDSTATAIEEQGVSPEDLARTVLTLLGIDPETRLVAGGNRPLALVKGGRVLRDVLA